MRLVFILMLSVSLIACQGQGPKETGGSLIGAAAGGLLGSQFGKGKGQLVGVALGTLAGYQLGGALGRQMDAQDRTMANKATYNALENSPDHRSVSWQNPNNNHSGTVLITRTREDSASNKVCRDYVQTVHIDGQQEKIHGRACRDVRDPKAEWIVQE